MFGVCLSTILILLSAYMQWSYWRRWKRFSIRTKARATYLVIFFRSLGIISAIITFTFTGFKNVYVFILLVIASLFMMQDVIRLKYIVDEILDKEK